MKRLKVSFDKNFELSMWGPRGTERIKIINEYPDTPFSKFIFSNVGLMHLIAPYLPEKISTDFVVAKKFKKLIGAMYKSEKQELPSFKTEIAPDPQFSFPPTNPNKVIIAYSAGKDSMWNLWWAQKKYGPKNVLAVHISGLNKGNALQEVKYTKKQQKKIGFQLKTIDLLNSSRNTGNVVMRSREIFLTGIIIPIALEFNASKIITERFTGNVEDPSNYFASCKENMVYFNKILKSFRVPVQISWRSDRKELEVTRDLIKYRPDWFCHMCNCYVIPVHQSSLRNSWKSRAPTLGNVMYDSQCGSCAKCRIINLIRILYDPAIKNVKKKDIQTYLKDTLRWTMKKGDKLLADWVDKDFLEYLNKAIKKYGLGI